MKPRTQRALGIDLGEHRISAALVEKSAQGLRVIAAASGMVSNTEPPRGGPPHAKVLSQVLRKVTGRAASRGTGTVVAVSTPVMVMRLLDLPKQMPANVGAFVDNELAQCVALSGRKRQSDFCAVGPGAGPRKRLLAVAADADQVGEILKTCIPAGVTADAVEPSSLAYVRAFLADEQGLRHVGNVVVAVLGVHRLAIHLFRDGALDFVRVRDVPAGVESVESLCAWLTEELDAVVRYCGADAPGAGTAWRIRLALHNVAHTKDHLAARLDVESGGRPVEVVDCQEHLASLPGKQGKDAAEPPSAMAIGAALRLLESEGDALRIDLMPREAVQAKRSSRRMWIMANAAAGILLAALLITEFLTQTTGAMDRQVEQMRLAERLPMMSALVQEDRYLDQEIQQVQGQLAHLRAACTRAEVDWPTVLDSIWQTRPDGVSLTYLLCEDNRRVLLKGVAVSPGQARAFVQNLDARASFASAWMKHIERQPPDDGVFEFEIYCVVRTTD